MRKILWLIITILFIYAVVAGEADPKTAGSVVVFLVDSSGSMKENDAPGLRFRAVSDFTSLGSEDAHFMLIAFDSQARLLYDGEVKTPQQKELFYAVLNNLRAEGKQTSLDAGFQGALESLRKYPKAKKFVILLTDAMNTDTYRNTHRLLYNQGVQIFAVGCGTGETPLAYVGKAFFEVLKKISKESGGAWFIARSGQDLLPIYRNIASKVFHRSTLLTQHNIAIGKGKQPIGEWYLEEGTSMLCVSVETHKGMATLTLVIPDNSVLHFSEEQVSPGVIASTVGQWSALMIEKPKPGRYQLIAQADNQACISALADVNSSIRAWVNSEKPYYRQGESAVLSFDVSGEAQVDSTVMSILAPNGGVYRLPEKKTNKTQYFTPSGIGVYAVTIDIAGNSSGQGSFTRQAVCTFEVLSQYVTFQVIPHELTLKPRYPRKVDFSVTITGKEGAIGAVSLVEAFPSDSGQSKGFLFSAQQAVLHPGSSSQMKVDLAIPKKLKAGQYPFNLVFRSSHSQEVVLAPFTISLEQFPFWKKVLRAVWPWGLIGAIIVAIIVGSIIISIMEKPDEAKETINPIIEKGKSWF